MNPNRYPCPTCGRVESVTATRPCFFCESANRIDGFSRDQVARGQAYAHNTTARQVKPVHNHRLLVTRGHRGRC